MALAAVVRATIAAAQLEAVVVETQAAIASVWSSNERTTTCVWSSRCGIASPAVGGIVVVVASGG
jgi:hypothetical protein